MDRGTILIRVQKVAEKMQDVQNAETDIVFYPSRGKMLLLTLGCFLFVATAPLVWTTGSLFLRAIAVVDVLFFGFGILCALRRLLNPSPALVIDSEGVVDTASAVGAGLLRWEEIESVAITEMGINRFLVIIPRDPSTVLARQPWLKREVMRANIGMVGGPVTIPENALSVSLEEVLMYLQNAASRTHQSHSAWEQ